MTTTSMPATEHRVVSREDWLRERIALTAYQYIDVTPKGLDEAQTSGMGWLRHHDRYDDPNFVDPWAEKPGITGPLAR